MLEAANQCLNDKFNFMLEIIIKIVNVLIRKIVLVCSGISC